MSILHEKLVDLRLQDTCAGGESASFRTASIPRFPAPFTGGAAGLFSFVIITTEGVSDGLPIPIAPPWEETPGKSAMSTSLMWISVWPLESTRVQNQVFEVQVRKGVDGAGAPGCVEMLFRELFFANRSRKAGPRTSEIGVRKGRYYRQDGQLRAATGRMTNLTLRRIGGA